MEKEDADNSYRKSLPKKPQKARIYKLRCALCGSFILISISGIIGLSIGLLLNFFLKGPDSLLITILQIIGALILLWATLSLRGWDIQSYSGVTFTERINQLIYRFLYCLGTTIFIISMIWK